VIAIQVDFTSLSLHGWPHFDEKRLRWWWHHAPFYLYNYYNS